MLKKPASIVLASLPGTVKRETSVSRGVAALLGTTRVSARRGWAGKKSGLFEHPAGEPIAQDVQAIEVLLS